MTVMPGWRKRALIAISEGYCPEHLTRLDLDGWCDICSIWWSADFPADTVISRYPWPGSRVR